MKLHILPIFGISLRRLQTIVDRIAGEPVRSFEVNIKHKKLGPSGICGDYLVPTFTFVTKFGNSGETTVFARRPHKKRPGSLQQHHYAYLYDHNVPYLNFTAL